MLFECKNCTLQYITAGNVFPICTMTVASICPSLLPTFLPVWKLSTKTMSFLAPSQSPKWTRSVWTLIVLCRGWRDSWSAKRVEDKGRKKSLVTRVMIYCLKLLKEWDQVNILHGPFLQLFLQCSTCFPLFLSPPPPPHPLPSLPSLFPCHHPFSSPFPLSLFPLLSPPSSLLSPFPFPSPSSLLFFLPPSSPPNRGNC